MVPLLGPELIGFGAVIGPAGGGVQFCIVAIFHGVLMVFHRFHKT